MIGLALDMAPPAMVYRLPAIGADLCRHYLGLLESAAQTLRAEWQRMVSAGEASRVQLSRANGVLDALFVATVPGRAPLERIPALRALARVLDGDPERGLLCAASYASAIPQDVLRALRQAGSVVGCGIAPGYALLRELISPTDQQIPGFPHGLFSSELKRIERHFLIEGPNPVGLLSRSPGSSFAEQIGLGLTLQRGLGPRVRFHLDRAVMLPGDLSIARDLRYPFDQQRLHEVQSLLYRLEQEVLISPPFSNGRVIQAAAIYVISSLLSEGRSDPAALTPIAVEAGCAAEWIMLAGVLAGLIGSCRGARISPTEIAHRIAQSSGELVRQRSTRDVEVLDLSRAVGLVLEITQPLPLSPDRSFTDQLIGYAVAESAEVDLSREPPYADLNDLNPAIPQDDRLTPIQNLRIARLTGMVTDRKGALALIDQAGAARRSDLERSPIVCGDAPGLSRSDLRDTWRIGDVSVRLFENESLGQFRPSDKPSDILRQVRRSGAYPAINAELDEGFLQPEAFQQILRAEPRIGLPEIERLVYAMRFWRQAPNYQFRLDDFLSIAGSTLIHAKIQHAEEDFLLDVGCKGAKAHTGGGWAHIIDGRTKELLKLSKRSDWPDGFDDVKQHFLRFGVIPALAAPGGEIPSSRAPDFYAFKTAPMTGSDDLFVSVLVVKLPAALCEERRQQRSVATTIIHSKGPKMRDFLLREVRGLAGLDGWRSEIDRFRAAVNPIIESAGLRPISRAEVLEKRDPPPVPDSPVPAGEWKNIAPFADGSAPAHRRPAVPSDWYLGNLVLPDAAASCVWLPPMIIAIDRSPY